MDGTDLECMAQKIYTYVCTSITTTQIERLSSSSAPQVAFMSITSHPSWQLWEPCL